jgi:hypothetical protein
MVIEMAEEREFYLVSRWLHDELASEIVPVVLFTIVDPHGNLSLWPVKIARDGGRSNHWHESALSAAASAMTAWVRVQANMDLKSYDVFLAEGKLPDPRWPDMSFPSMLRIAFRDRLISSLEHPLIAKLRGRA